MKRLGLTILLLTASCGLGFAQQWEIGATGGAGFLNHVGVTAPAGSATAGFQTGFAAGGFLAQNLYSHLSGELRYGLLQSNLRLHSGGTTATFSGWAHVVHYDLILHTNRRHSKTQYFVAFGGGMKVFQGTGTEQASQSLSSIGYFTKTHTVKPMASVGAGLKYTLRPRLFLRAEFRDYITPFPTEVITPAPNTKYGNILNDIVPMVGISYEF